MTNNNVLLEISDLRVTFDTDSGPVRAVDGASLSLRRGQVLAIVGESGCGKTVLAHCLLRLVQGSRHRIEGRIQIHRPGQAVMDVLSLGANSLDLYALRGGVASMIFQEPQSALSPVHTIGEQICEAILVHQPVSRREAERIATDMLIEVGIQQAASRMKQYPHELSGGMRQRVVIAMALVCKPLLLIADEPTTALDLPLQGRVLYLIRQMQSTQQTAVLLITHDFNVVNHIADEVAIMYCGRVVERGSALDLMNTPRHPYTKALLASQPGNATRDRRKRLSFLPGVVPSLTALPDGCAFHPRCQHAQPGKCDQGAQPALRQLSVNHEVACVRAEELAHGG